MSERPDWDYFADDCDDDDAMQECFCDAVGCPECDARYYENYDCGMGRDGQCMYAGSEECDWECPLKR